MVYVYFAHCEQAEAVKIGKAKKASSRLSELQVGNPMALCMVDVIEDESGRLEGLLHRWFRDKRIRGEWFKITPDDVRVLVAKIKEQGTEFLEAKYPITSTQDGDSWSELLRKAVRNSGKTQYALAQAAEIGETQLARFMAGKGLSLSSAGRLGAVLGEMRFDDITGPFAKRYPFVESANPALSDLLLS